MPSCESYNTLINNAYKKLVTNLLNLFTEFNSQNESLVALLNDYSTDINANKEALSDILDEYILVRSECCYNIVIAIDRIIELFNLIPCIDPHENIPTTTAEVTTTAEATTTLDENLCNSATIVNEKGSYYPHTTIKYLGAETGLVTLTFDSFDIPDRFVVEFDGDTVIDTGYVGNPVFQPYIDAAVLIEGDIAGDITNVTTGSISFLKDSSVEYATVKVYSPLSNTRFEFTLSCPDDTIECLDIALDVDSIDFATTTIEATTTLEVTTTNEPTTTVNYCIIEGYIDCYSNITTTPEPTTTSEVTTTAIPTTTVEPTTTSETTTTEEPGLPVYTDTATAGTGGGSCGVGFLYPLTSNVFDPSFVVGAYYEPNENWEDLEYIEIVSITVDAGLTITYNGSPVAPLDILYAGTSATDFALGTFDFTRAAEGTDNLAATMTFKIKLVGYALSSTVSVNLEYDGCIPEPTTTGV